MLNKGYAFKTSREIDGEVYVKLSEVEEVLENLDKLGPTFQQVADAAERLKKAFAGSSAQANNLLLDSQRKLDGLDIL